MSREITLDRKLEVVKLYFGGLPYDDIAKKIGVAKGSVAATVEALRTGEFPQFGQVTDMVNALRDLTVGLRKAGLTITEAASLFILVEKLIGLGVEPVHLESWIRMCLVGKRHCQDFFHYLVYDPDVAILGNGAVRQFHRTENTRWHCYRSPKRFITWAVKEGCLKHNALHGITLKMPVFFSQQV